MKKSNILIWTLLFMMSSYSQENKQKTKVLSETTYSDEIGAWVTYKKTVIDEPPYLAQGKCELWRGTTLLGIYNYKEGELDGETQLYFANNAYGSLRCNQPIYRITYKKGKKISYKYFRCESNKYFLENEFYYDDLEKVEREVTYFENTNQKKSDISKNGQCTTWFENGKISEKYYQKWGEKDGDYTSYSENGKIIKSSVYKNANKISTTEYDEQGHKILVTTNLEGYDYKDEKYKYSNDGKLLSKNEVSKINGNLTGKKEVYDSKGNILFTRVQNYKQFRTIVNNVVLSDYHNGSCQYIEYYPNGSIRKKGKAWQYDYTSSEYSDFSWEDSLRCTRFTGHVMNYDTSGITNKVEIYDNITNTKNGGKFLFIGSYYVLQNAILHDLFLKILKKCISNSVTDFACYKIGFNDNIEFFESSEKITCSNGSSNEYLCNQLVSDYNKTFYNTASFYYFNLLNQYYSIPEGDSKKAFVEDFKKDLIKLSDIFTLGTPKQWKKFSNCYTTEKIKKFLIEFKPES